MPRITQERLVGYSLAVTHRVVPVVDHEHMLHNGKGEAKTRDVWDLILTDPSSGHSVIVTLDAEGKQAVVAALTGGVVLAPGERAL